MTFKDIILYFKTLFCIIQTQLLYLNKENIQKQFLNVKNQIILFTQRRDINHTYKTTEDFKRMPTDNKRIVVIGSKESNKSSLLNILGGLRHLTSMTRPIFQSLKSTDKSRFVNIEWLGEKNNCITIIDSYQNNEIELLTKIKLIGHIDIILVVNEKSDCINTNTLNSLKTIENHFKACGKTILNNVVIVNYINKIDDHDNMSLQLTDYKSKNPIPILDLSNDNDDFNKLSDSISSLHSIESNCINPFLTGFEKSLEISNNNKSILKEESRKVYFNIVTKMFIMIGFLFWRGFLINSYLSILFLNIPMTVIDDILVLYYMVYIIGPMCCYYSILTFYKLHMKSFINKLS